MWLCWVVTTSRITISCDNPPPVSWVSLFSCCLCSAGAEWRVVSWMSCTWARCTLSINTSLVPQPLCLGKIPLPPPADLATAVGLLVVQIFRYLSWLIFHFVNVFFFLLSSVFEPGCDTVHVFPSTPYCQLRYFSYYDQIVCADPNRRWVYPTNKYCVCVHQLCRRAQLFFQKLLKLHQWQPVLKKTTVQADCETLVCILC